MWNKKYYYLHLTEEKNIHVQMQNDWTDFRQLMTQTASVAVTIW